MIYTITYYLLILFFAFFIKNKQEAINNIVIASVLYWGLRYNYMNDYEAYHLSFDYAQNMSQYNAISFHAEIGWWILYKLFQPVGFYVFVFTCSLFLIIAIKPWLKEHVPQEYLWIVVIGLFSAPYFNVLSSAQRQWLVSAFFLFAYYFLIRGRIHTWKDLTRRNTLLYFIIIYFCKYFHSSALFLELIPFLYFVPKKSITTAYCFIGVFLVEMSLGHLVIPRVFDYVIMCSGGYDYLAGSENGAMEQMSMVNWLMNLFQFIVIGNVYVKGQLNDDESVTLLLTLLSIIINSTVYFVPEFHRISMYFVFFQYISIGIILSQFKKTLNKTFYTPILLTYIIWIGWNILKITMIKPGSTNEYKCVLSLFI